MITLHDKVFLKWHVKPTWSAPGTTGRQVCATIYGLICATISVTSSARTSARIFAKIYSRACVKICAKISGRISIMTSATDCAKISVRTFARISIATSATVYATISKWTSVLRARKYAQQDAQRRVRQYRGRIPWRPQVIAPP